MTTREPQYQCLLDVAAEEGTVKLGLTANEAYLRDPKRLLFNMARYKFVSRMLAGKENALEIGCGDGFGARLVRQVVPDVIGIDFDPIFIKEAKNKAPASLPISFFVHDILEGPVLRNGESESFDAAYSLDVLEHIDVMKEGLFLENVCLSLNEDGIFIVGTPSLESQKHASKQSRIGHVNCKTGGELRYLLQKYFKNVFMFSMNDEVVHTGFLSMAHYLIGIGIGPE